MFMSDDTQHMDNYIIKVFDKDLVFKRSIRWTDIEGDISYSSLINSGFSNLKLRLHNRGEVENITEVIEWANYYNTLSYSSGIWIEHWDIIKVFDPKQNVVSTVDLWWGDYYKTVSDTAIYMGQVIEISSIIEWNTEYFLIDSIGIQKTAKDVLYESWSSFTFTTNADPAVLLKEIIDLVPYLSYTGSSIETFWSSIQLNIDHFDCLKAIKEIQKVTWWALRYDADGVVYFYEMVSSPTVDHAFTFGKTIISIEDKNESYELYNKLILKHGHSGGWTAHTDIIEDTTSQTTYGVREKYEEQPDIKDETTALAYWDAFLAEYAYPKQEVIITINNTYELSTIKPWHAVKVYWYWNTNSVYYVYQVDFTPDSVVLHLNKQSTIENTLNSLLTK